MNANTLAERGIQSPLLIEIANLKAALSRYQTTADTANLHLQRQALDSSALAARCTALEQDNALLQAEIQFLRSIPDSTSTTASIQVSELSLALRHVQDKVRLSEEELKSVNEKLGLALKAKTKALYEVEGMEDLVKSTRAREEEWMKRVRDLESTIRRLEEEKKMVEVCVKEYADLVRGLEGRMSLSTPPLNPPSANLSTIGLTPPIEEASTLSQDSTSGSGSSGPGSQHSRTSSIQTHSRAGSAAMITITRPIDSLQEGRLGLQRLLSEFHKQTEKLETEIARLHGELEMMEMQLEQKERLGEENEREIGRLKGELSALGRADKSASMMVEKYMRFSQQSTNLLQTALQTQKQRHAATVSTLQSQIATLNRTIEREQIVSSKLRETLDELTLEISKESYGRRREVSLRLALVERERKIGRTLEWWINTMERGKDSLAGDAGRARAVERANIVLHVLKGVEPGLDQQQLHEEDDQRIQAVMLDCEELAKELELETERRMELERRLIRTIGREPRDVTTHHQRRKPSNEEEESQESPVVETPETNGAEQDDDNEEEEVVRQEDQENSPVQESPSPPEVVENDVAAEQQPSSPTDTISANEATPEPELELEPDGRFKDIITSLHGTSTRYDALQSSFTDCHNALSELRSSLDSIAHEITAGDVVGNYLLPAVERLDDYCEDARVELEILIADEARIVQGYETLLMVSSSSTSREGEANTQFSEDELLKKIDRFVNGTEPSMERARVAFGEKLDNLMHDIVIIKKQMHDRMNGSPFDESDPTKDSPVAVPARLSDHNGAGDLESMSARNGSGIWKTLTSSMLSPPALTPRASSPRPVPTFGSLMTSGRPRQPSTHEQSAPDTNPLNRLGLRIATPKSNLAGQSPNSFHFNNIHSPFPFGLTSPDYQAVNGGETQPNSAPLSRVGSGWLGSGGMVRARTMSNMHSAGFGIGMGMTPKNMTQYGRPASRAGSDAGISLNSGRRRTSGLSNEESGIETRGDDEIE